MDQMSQLGTEYSEVMECGAPVFLNRFDSGAVGLYVSGNQFSVIDEIESSGMWGDLGALPQ
jgi:hypothetical protein